MPGGEQSSSLYTTSTSGALNNLLKEIYGGVNMIARQRRKTYDLLSKSKRPMSGKYWLSADHMEGGSGAVGSRPDGVELPPSRQEIYANARVYDKFHYAGIRLTGPVMAHAKGDLSSFVNVLTSEVEHKTNWLIDLLNIEFYQDGWGVIATVVSVAGSVLTVTTPNSLWLKKGVRFDIYSSTWKTATTAVKHEKSGVAGVPATRQGHTIASVAVGATTTVTITGDTLFVTMAGAPAATDLAADTPVAGDFLVFEDLMGGAGNDVSSGNSRESDVVGGEGAGLSGLDVMVDTTTNAASYQSVDRAAFPEYSGNVLANGGVARPLTLDLLQRASDEVLKFSGREPDTWMSGLGQRRNLLSLGLPDVRHGSEQIKLGYKVLNFNGSDWFVDEICQSSRVYALCRENNIYRYESVPLGPLSSDGLPLWERIPGFDVREQYLGTFFNTGCDRPQCNAKLTDLQEP